MSRKELTKEDISKIKKFLRENPNEGAALGDLIIKNTYRTLMTRGMKGCYIFCTDEETREFFRTRLYEGIPNFV